MGLSVFNVEDVDHTLSMQEEMGSSVLEQRLWNLMMPMQEGVETSFPSTEDVRTMCYLSGKEWSPVFLM